MHLINCNSFLQFLFFVTFITIHVIQCNDSQGNCLAEKPKLGKDDKLHILFFYQSEHDNGLAEILCEVVRKHRDRLSMEFKVGPLAKKSGDSWVCPNDNNCDSNRYVICKLQFSGGAENCGEAVWISPLKSADCLCNHDSDGALQKNADDWATYKLSDDKVPTLILNGKWDPCLDVSSAAAFEAYINNIYK